MDRLVTACAALLLLSSASALADDKASLARLLERQIISDRLPLEEVQSFTESRVPKMPDVTSKEEWQRHAERIRRGVLENVVFRGRAAAWRDAKTGVKWLGEIKGGPGYRIKKLRYEALPGLWIPALLYEPEKLSGKVPVVMNVNGHDGKGKVAKYKQIRCINQAKRGMIALNVEWLGMGQLRTEGFRHYRMNQLDLCGTSGLAPFYLSMKRGLDVLLSHEHADPRRVAVAGLSGGGWQTIVISALDTRVTLADPVAGYSSFRTRARHLSDLGDSEQTPSDLATVADYNHLTALMAPRALLLTYNIRDNCCFASGHALPPLLEAARPIYRLYGQTHRLRWHVNEDPGTHNFEKDNRQALYRMFRDHFYDASTGFRVSEIECGDELKTAEQLQVDLPEKNADFHTLAMDLMKDLPRDAKLPGDKQAALNWQRDRAAELKKIVRFHEYGARAKQTGKERQGDIQATFWQLSIGEAWTVPVVELVSTKSQPTGATIVVADGGRTAAAAEITRLLSDGKRVVAVDPFYFGESKIIRRGHLFALLVAAVGERPLGLQASQLAAVARWLDGTRKSGPVTILADGPRSSLYSLVAAGLEKESIAGLQLRKCYGSLKEIVEQNGAVDKTPELFCFGLLERFDVKHLAALAAPRNVEFVQPSDRAKKELSGLAAWKSTLGEGKK